MLGGLVAASDNDLYIHGVATLLASWEEYARGSPGASLNRRDGVAAAVFPSEPERGIYNNALLDRDLGPVERAAAVDAMDEADRSASVDRRLTPASGPPPEISGSGYVPRCIVRKPVIRLHGRVLRSG